MKSNRSLILLGVIVAAIAVAAIVMRGERPSAETPDLPSVPAEIQ